MPLYPVERTEYWGDDKNACRPMLHGGYIRLIHYWRASSNRLPEFGPFDRILDYGKLMQDITLDDVYNHMRYFWNTHVSVMGVSVRDRPEFEEFIFPAVGMKCSITTQAERDALDPPKVEQ